MNTKSSRHLIFGTGPAACWTARALIGQGISVNAINRSGKRPMLMPSAVTILKADVSNAIEVSKIVDASKDVSVVYQMLNPAYNQWSDLFPQLQTNTMNVAQQLGANYIALENLYMLDHRMPMTENSVVNPVSLKGRVRQSMHEELMTAYRSGSLKVATLRASDYFGPGVTVSAFGSRFFEPLVAGKSPSVMGSIDQPHSVAYIADVGRAAARLGLETADEFFGRAWLAPHGPALTQGQFISQVNARLTSRSPHALDLSPKVVKPWMLQMAGLFDKDAKALVEMMYQFQKPFVVDSSFSNQKLLLGPTQLDLAIDETLNWYLQSSLVVAEA
jgi:nucleoside-diphosphate-sugar epimerase